jgi:hypothetical protein
MNPVTTALRDLVGPGTPRRNVAFATGSEARTRADRVPLLNVGRQRRDGALAPTVRVNLPSDKFAYFPVEINERTCPPVSDQR